MASDRQRCHLERTNTGLSDHGSPTHGPFGDRARSPGEQPLEFAVPLHTRPPGIQGWQTTRTPSFLARSGLSPNHSQHAQNGDGLSRRSQRSALRWCESARAHLAEKGDVSGSIASPRSHVRSCDAHDHDRQAQLPAPYF
eukprot:gene48563-3458_t